ncbi:MAG: EthD family reductase [Pseudomonadota bacterium]
MFKVFAMYRKPDDVDAFLSHYYDVHIPLVEKIPGLHKAVVNRITAAPMGGEPVYFLVVELQFPDKETFGKAMASPENQAAGQDLATFAKDLVDVMIAEA